jgi:phage portal protein BeeE/2'-5' RNA ligase
MTAPVITLPQRSAQAARQSHAVKSQLGDLMALMRTEATPSELAKLYAVSVTAYRAANLRATVVANVPYRVENRKGEPLEDHPLNALLRDNPALPDILERSELTLCFWGHTLVYKRRAQRQRVTGLQWINPKLYRLHFDSMAGRLTGFDISAHWTPVDHDEAPPEGFITRADGVYMHGMDFDNDFDGVSPAENAFDFAGIETEAAQTAVWFLRNRAVPAALLQPKDGDDTAPPNTRERNMMKRLVNRILQGARNAGKTIVASGRWEWVVLQSPFDEVEFQAQHTIAREGVSMSFEVPLDLLLPTSATFAEMYMSEKSWVEHFAKNRCKWYARQLTRELAPEFGDDIVVAPDFSSVFQRDDAQTIDVTNTKLQGGYLTLYDAQLATGQNEPDERLKDIYVVNGEPVHIERLVTLAREGRYGGLLPSGANGDDDDQPPSGSAQHDAQAGEDSPPAPPTDDGADKLPPQPAKSAPDAQIHTQQGGDTPPQDAQPDDQSPPETQNDTSARKRAQPDDWLPDAVFKELRDCVRVVARRGAGYDFEPVMLPADVVAYVRLLVAAGGDPDDTDALVTAARRYYTGSSEWRAMRGYSDVEARYRAALYDLIRKFFARQIGRQEIGDLGRAEISAAYEAAFKQGLVDAGTLVTKLSEAEAAFVHEQAIAERRHWTRLSNAVLKRLRAAQDTLDAVRQQLKAATDPDEQERLRAELLAAKQDLIAARDAVLARLDLWAQGLRRMYSQGQLSGERNPMVRWDMDAAKENCRTCRALDGQLHRAAEWSVRNLYPGSDVLECVWSAKGVPVCGCGFQVVTDQAARGNLDAVPVFGPARSLGIAAKSERGAPAGTALLHLATPDPVLALQDELIAAHPALTDVRWTPDAHLHITLVHSPLAVDDAFADIFTAVAGSVTPFEVHASRLEAFEVGDDHRAIVLLIDDTPDLHAFQRRVYDEFKACDFPLSEYSTPADWQPHITLGYERADTPFESRDVDITVTTGALVFSRSDYQAVHRQPPNDTGDQPGTPDESEEEAHAVQHD